MSTIHRFIEATPDEVFAVLANGWLFPSWVVGASRIRDVEEAWPAVDSKIHHSFGVWPVVIDDSTSVVDWSPPVRAEFVARGWPLGEADVTIEVQDRSGGCFVTMTEYARSGPGTLVPPLLMEPVLNVRNREALQRLAWLVEGGAAE
ncbi:SRPBCC family protein [Frondihabitans peucedani]|uniref:SRPBCC family protein n=1 Tax=Frondihabitans peucedani TaxID=598626 RepID=A0ABP8E482_9MICO